MRVQPFFVTSFTGEDAHGVVAQCRELAEEKTGAASLGLVYVTEPMLTHLPDLLAVLREATSVTHWLGCSGAGICANHSEIYDRPAAAIMLLDIAAHDWRALPADDFTAALRVAGEWDAQFPGSLGLLHTNGAAAFQDGRLQQLVNTIENTFLVGGLSTADSGGEIPDTGVSGALFAPQIAVAVDHTQGCTPIGSRHRISSAERNIAITLDERPALEVLREDIGEVMARDLRRAGNYIFAALSVPGSDTGDYMVRNLIGIDEQHGLVAIGDDLEGQHELMFCRRDGNSAREDLIRMAETLHKRVAGRPIRGGVYVSCLARGRHQFGDDSEEVRTLQETLGPFPMVGFFANGEIYNGRVYGYTGVLTLFL